MLSKLKEPAVLKTIIAVSAAAVISRTFSFITFFYYLLPIPFLLIFYEGYRYFITDKALRTLLLLLFLFGTWCAVTASWSDYPAISLVRAGYFIFISSGALLAGYLWKKTNFISLSFLIPANIIIAAVSLFSLVTNIPLDSWTGGHGKGFMGFAGHQNTLASAILFTMPALIRQRAKGKEQRAGGRGQREKVKNIFFGVLLLLNIIILFLTYSRASIFSLACGAIIFLILNKKWKILAYAAIAGVLISGIIWISPSLKEKTSELLKKDFPAFYSSREWLWVPSYHAALEGGITGLGYGISHPEIIVEGIGSYYVDGRYVREKGNSLLALIEEAGLIGFLIFIAPLIYLLYQSRYPASGIRYHSLLLASIAAFIIHAQFEAWMVGVGSIQLPLFFFYLGSLIEPTTNDHK